ncbi:MAG TPA: YggS family pyridoxal phosphate-dependent enzyme [Bacillales bacterium]|nr:YggS family pyridoxal phosphate-dependent enzyme [Bacillales bacterium]
MSVAINAAQIREKIEAASSRSGRKPNEVQIIAVTKYVSIETAEEALDSGIRHIGESRDSGFLMKREVLGERAVWHFIGTLQSRKVKTVIDQVDYLHSLNRLSLAKEIQKRATGRVRCFVQVNVSGEESKHGIATNKVQEFIKKLVDYPKIEVVGLMTMAPHIENRDEIRSVFRELRKLAEDVQSRKWGHAPCRELSMGMSNDFEIAVEEGATFVRLGTRLVGKEF